MHLHFCTATLNSIVKAVVSTITTIGTVEELLTSIVVNGVVVVVIVVVVYFILSRLL